MKVIFLKNYKDYKIGDKALIKSKEEIEYLKKTETIEEYVETPLMGSENEEIEELKKQLEESIVKIKELEKTNKNLTIELNKISKADKESELK